MSEKIDLMTRVDVESIIDSVVFSMTEEQVIDFVLRIDEEMASMEFSEGLLKKLKKVVKKEKKAGA